MTPPAGVLLAAGGGSRLGGPKALVRLGGELLVERAARVLAGGGCAPVVVVLGAAADVVEATARLGGSSVVRNERWAEGMGGSFRAGLAALGPGVPAAVIALVDQPWVTPDVIRRLVAAWRGGAAAAVASYRGLARNPVILDRGVWDEAAAAAEGDQGARAFLRAHAHRVTAVPCDDAGAPDDIDTPADLSRVQEKLCN